MVLRKCVVLVLLMIWWLYESVRYMYEWMVIVFVLLIFMRLGCLMIVLVLRIVDCGRKMIGVLNSVLCEFVLVSVKVLLVSLLGFSLLLWV